MNFRDYINLIETYHWDDTTILFELFDVEKFLSRAKGVQSLIVRGASEGEKEAAKQAMDRMLARAKDEVKELPLNMQQDFWRRFEAIRANTSNNAERASARRSSDDFYRGAQPKPGAQQGYKAKPDQAERDAEYARKQEQSRRNQEQSQDRGRTSGGGRGELGVILEYAEFREGTSDKVYGVVKWNGDYYTFWGRNGGGLATKQQDSHNAANIIFHSKIRKGYVQKPVTPSVDRWVMQNLRF